LSSIEDDINPEDEEQSLSEDKSAIGVESEEEDVEDEVE